ncbi:hypothetical protein BHE74_00049172 [Ensete ventricosum]|nr:hypothetical protein BHE74_00049172 [Ensete ventricosum]
MVAYVDAIVEQPFRRSTSTSTKSKSAVKAIAEIHRLSKQDPKMCPPPPSTLCPSLLPATLTTVATTRPRPRPRRTLLLLATFLNLSISTCEVLMCTLGILDTLIAALRLLFPVVAQHAAAALYNLLSVEAYHSIIG